MLPSMLTNLFWGSSQSPEPNNDAMVKHTTREEAGDWLLISCSESNSERSNSRVNSECDLDSVNSDASWVITPAPTFKRSIGGDEPSYPMEDLLIEHPTMSIYHQNSRNEEEKSEDGKPKVNDDGNDENDDDDNNDEERAIELRNQNRELVMMQNRQRQQLAMELNIPLTRDVNRTAPKRGSNKPPKLTRRALKRQNPTTRIGVKHQVQKCGFKAGRRRS